LKWGCGIHSDEWILIVGLLIALAKG